MHSGVVAYGEPVIIVITSSNLLNLVTVAVVVVVDLIVGNLTIALRVSNDITVQYCELIPWVGGCHGIVLHQGLMSKPVSPSLCSRWAERCRFSKCHETTSSLVLCVREVEEAWTVSKRQEHPPLARSGRQGRWRGRKQRQKAMNVHLRLALACEGGGGEANRVAQTVSKCHRSPPPAHCCMRGKWRRHRCKNHLRGSPLHVREVVVARMAVCRVRERAACVQTCFQC